LTKILEPVGSHAHHTTTAAHGHGDNDELFVHEFRDDQGSKVGMWIFIFTEVLLFGGLFFVYFYYRNMYGHDFHNAALHLDIAAGTNNTLILLTSSLTMVLGLAALQKGKKIPAVLWTFLTVGFGGGFLYNKYFEWSHKIHDGIFPGSETLQMFPHGEIEFYGLYYLMTGLHTLHVIIGMILLTVCAFMMMYNSINTDKYVVLENSGLYWHLVDLIWIFLFPLFYLLH
jgi:cytochrome c oxidase subunit III